MNSVGAFLRDRAVIDTVLACPVRVLWRDYLAYCGAWGFDVETAAYFVKRVSSEEGIRVKTGGHGRLRRYFEGVGINAGSLNKGNNAA